MRRVSELEDAEADAMIRAAVGTAGDLGIRISAAVVDRGGQLKRFTRMDGAEIAGVTLAPRKAVSALANSCDTDELARQARHDLYGIETDFTVVAGGVVIRDEHGDIVGALGVSGGTADQDRDCARSGQASLMG